MSQLTFNCYYISRKFSSFLSFTNLISKMSVEKHVLRNSTLQLMKTEIQRFMPPAFTAALSITVKRWIPGADTGTVENCILMVGKFYSVPIISQ